MAGQLTVNAPWLDASGADGGVACLGGSLVAARFVAPAGGAFGAGGVVDAGGYAAARAVIEPERETLPAGESGAHDVPGDGGGTAGEPSVGPAGETGMPATATNKATTVTKVTSTKATVTKPSKPHTAATTTAKLPKTADSPWIALPSALFLLGTVLACAGLGSASVCV